ncbi:hypothetical protein QOT17_023632 [Balamuthia mandrillaris]
MDLLKKYSISEAMSVDTLQATGNKKGVNRHVSYKNAIGSLMCVLIRTKPDIALAINTYAIFNNNLAVKYEEDHEVPSRHSVIWN